MTVTRIPARLLRAILHRIAPIGYEDAQGWHPGAPDLIHTHHVISGTAR